MSFGGSRGKAPVSVVIRGGSRRSVKETDGRDNYGQCNVTNAMNSHIVPPQAPATIARLSGGN
jgi:hypothetical protein